MVLRGIHPVVFEMTRCALVGLKFDGPNVLSLVAMEGRITSRCNYTTWTEPYYVQIFFHGLPTGPVSIGKVAYPAMVLPPFATHALNQTGKFLNVPKELAQQSMTEGGVSPMSIHMVARTRAQAFGASLPRLPANFDMKCTYQNHWGAAPTDTVCDTHLRPIWTR